MLEHIPEWDVLKVIVLTMIYGYTRIRKRMRLVISTILSKLKHFSRSPGHVHCKSGNLSKTVNDRVVVANMK